MRIFKKNLTIRIQCLNFVANVMKEIIIHIKYYINDIIFIKIYQKSNEYHTKHQTESYIVCVKEQ